MKPDVTRVLDVATMHLMTRTAPSLPAGFEQSNLGLVAAMLTSVREEYERAAARRVEENRAMRALFERAAGGVGDASLRARLEAMVVTPEQFDRRSAPQIKRIADGISAGIDKHLPRWGAPRLTAMAERAQEELEKVSDQRNRGA